MTTKMLVKRPKLLLVPNPPRRSLLATRRSVRFGRRRLLSAEVVLQRRATRWRHGIGRRVVDLPFAALLALFRGQMQVLRRHRWMPHR
jgi:hypothetical protein